MKTIFKTMVLAAVMMAGVQANAAIITCTIQSEEKTEEYTKLEFNMTREVPNDERGTVLSTDDGYPVGVNGLSFAVSKNTYGMSISAFMVNSHKPIALAAARDGKQLILIVPTYKLAVVCAEATR